MLRSSKISGMVSVYRKQTWDISIFPPSLVTICLPPVASGSSCRIGLTISSVGRIPAIMSAMEEISINAPEM